MRMDEQKACTHLDLNTNLRNGYSFIASCCTLRITDQVAADDAELLDRLASQ
jgi:hypothetical protein